MRSTNSGSTDSRSIGPHSTDPASNRHRTSLITIALTVTVLVALLPAQLAAATPPEGLPRLERSIAEQTVAMHFEEATPTRLIYRALGEHAGFDVTFDPKLRDTAVSIDLDGLDVHAALRRLSQAAGQFWRATDAKNIIVADDTPQNRRTYEPMVIRTFEVEHVRLADLMTVLRSILSLKNVAVDQSGQSLTMRDSAQKVAVAERLVERLDQPRKQVVLDLQLLRAPRATFAELRSTAGQKMLTISDEDRAWLEEEGTIISQPTLSIVSGQSARHQTTERITGDASTRRFDLDLAFDARSHPTSAAVTLGIHAQSKLVDDEGTISARDAESSITVTSEQSIALFDWLPLGDGSDDMTVLVIRPRIEAAKTEGAARTAGFFVGSEANIQYPNYRAID